MRLTPDKPDTTQPEIRKGEVLPGLIATVKDDNKNEVYVDLDLELEEITTDQKKTAALQSDIPPGLIASVTAQKKGKKFSFPVTVPLTRKSYSTIGYAALILGLGIAGGYWAFSPSANAPVQVSAVVQQMPELTEAQSTPPQPENIKEQPALVVDDAKELLISTEDEKQITPAHTTGAKISSGDTVQEPAVKKTAPPSLKNRTEEPAENEQPRPHESTDYYFYSGYTCEKKGDYAGALTWYKKALEIDARSYRLPNKIAFVLMQLSLYTDAEPYLQKSLTLKKDYVPALINMGIVSAKQGKFSDAEKYLDDVLARDGTNVNALYNMMLIYKKQSKYKPASEASAKLKTLGFPLQ